MSFSILADTVLKLTFNEARLLCPIDWLGICPDE